MSKSTIKAASAETRQQKPTEVAAPATLPRKPDTILNMLKRAKGASIKQLQEATNWQPHSIRAVICILRKKGVAISRSQAKDGTTLYHAKKA